MRTYNFINFDSLNLNLATRSAFSVATVLVQNSGVNAPGAIYPFFSVLAFVGMFMSTKIHHDGGIDNGSSTKNVGVEEGRLELILT